LTEYVLQNQRNKEGTENRMEAKPTEKGKKYERKDTRKGRNGKGNQ
jgi:hypothetical protein